MEFFSLFCWRNRIRAITGVKRTRVDEQRRMHMTSSKPVAPSLQDEADRLADSLADRFADGGFGTRRGGFEHHSRVVRQARDRVLPPT